MTLYVCEKCSTSVDIPPDSTVLQCPTCYEPLRYLGSESVALSTQDLIDAYDKEHPYTPIASYQGVYYTDNFRGDLNIDILECEDVLLNQPDNIDARFHLGTLLYSKGHFSEAEHHFLKIQDITPNLAIVLQGLVTLYLAKNDTHSAKKWLLALVKEVPTHYQGYEKLGYLYAKEQQYTLALSAYKNAYIHCPRHNKVSLNPIIKKLAEYLK